jgi:hypothetical protein
MYGDYGGVDHGCKHLRLRVCLFSYAEMEAMQKNAISHRGRALQKLCAYLQEAQDVESA